LTIWFPKCFSVLLLSLAIAIPATADRAPFSTGDLWQWREMGDPRINADGTRVVYAERYADRATDATRCNLWTVPTKGGEPRALTAGAWRDWEPRWSADGTKVAYLSDRAGKPQIFVSPVNAQGAEGGPAHQVTQLGTTPLSLTWSPDGNSIAFTARVESPPGVGAWAPREILPWLRQGPATREKLFLIPLAGGTVRALPVGELEVHGEPAWMPDGQSLLIAASAPPDAARALEGSEIFSVRVADGAVKQITRHAGPDEQPVPSPDGSRIAWIAREAKPQSYVTSKLYIANPDGSRDKVLAGSLDRDVVQPQWSSDSRTIYFLADDRGSTHVYAARNDGSVRPVTNGVERLRGFSLADNGRAVAVRSTAAAAAELITFTVDLPGKAEKLAAENETLLAERVLGVTEELQYTSGGKTIQGWIVKPSGFDAARKYPLLLDVEDDPRRMCGGEFRLRAQVFAARGMVVLCANPRGTPGYGEEFGNLIRSRYPGDDFDDLQAGVDAVVAKGYIDTARLGIAGGLLAAWALGHTARFHAAVARNPIVDWVPEVVNAADGLYRAAAWMGAMPWDDPDQYTKRSPVFYAGSFRTPTLVLAVGLSAGAEELYFALQARHVDSAMVRFPADGRPGQTVLEWETVLGWLAR
jgi:dipeptidyl aminopeptidase/acylaminoacyl peptidase